MKEDEERKEDEGGWRKMKERKKNKEDEGRKEDEG